MQENLRFATARAYIPNTRQRKNAQGYYYPYQELDSLCPTDWRIVHEEDWGGMGRGVMSMWVHDKLQNDRKMHLHIGDAAFVKHAHAHHIDDKPTKNRKFVVRCVQD